MADQSTRTTGNDPVEGLDPGGTRSTRPGQRDGGKPATEQKVQSGDENDDPQRQPGSPRHQ